MEAKSQKATHQIKSRAVANNVNESKRRDVRGKEIIDNRSDNLVQLKYKALMNSRQSRLSLASQRIETFSSKLNDINAKPWIANYTTPGVLQMAPLFEGSQIDYNADTGEIKYGAEGATKNIAADDFVALQTAVGQMLTLRTDRESLEKQLKKYFVGKHVILNLSLVAKQWTQLAAHLQKIDDRRLADNAKLKAAGLIQEGDTFEAYELAGADPHKGGESTMMLRYKTTDDQTKKIVYKPADLTPERVLFAGDEFRVQQYGGTYAKPKDKRISNVYGYMTFLEGTGPQNAEDVRSIYHSLGEGLAIAYVYGLRDLHHENYIMFRNRIQWIDLEALTGTFTDFQSTEIASLFPSMADRMYKTLRAAIEPGEKEWFRARKRRKNRAALVRKLKAINIEDAIREGFTAKKLNIPAEAPQAAKWMTRFVPFPTDDLYDVVNQWHDKAELDKKRFPPIRRANRPVWFTTKIALLKGKYPGPAEEVNAMMTATSTRRAIRRGDIPFFMRQGNSIYGEDGKRIVKKSKHPRLQSEKKIQAGIGARREGPAPESVKASLKWVTDQMKHFHENRLYLMLASEKM
jgi:hypothetical protein